jgi:hypothetical protein
MKLILAPETRVGALKAAFSRAFPCLRLELASTKTKQEITEAPERLPNSARLADVTDVAMPFTLNITATNTTKELDSWFERNLFLHAIIFRNCGPFWVQVTESVDLSLRTQSERSEAGL